MSLSGLQTACLSLAASECYQALRGQGACGVTGQQGSSDPRPPLPTVLGPGLESQGRAAWPGGWDEGAGGKVADLGHVKTRLALGGRSEGPGLGGGLGDLQGIFS